MDCIKRNSHKAFWFESPVLQPVPHCGRQIQLHGKNIGLVIAILNKSPKKTLKFMILYIFFTHEQNLHVDQFS